MLVFSLKAYSITNDEYSKINKLIELENIDKAFQELKVIQQKEPKLSAKAQILITAKNENQYFEDNVTGLQKTLNFCKLKNIKKFIFASSASVYGDTRNKKVSENMNLSPLHYYAFYF